MGRGWAGAGSAGAQAGCSWVLARWGTGRRKAACELPAQRWAAGEFGEGGRGGGQGQPEEVCVASITALTAQQSQA